MRFNLILLFLLFSFYSNAQRKSKGELHYGQIFHFGDAKFHESISAFKESRPIYAKIKSSSLGFFITSEYGSRSNFHFSNELQFLKTSYKANSTRNIRRRSLFLQQSKIEINSPFLFSYEINKKKLDLKFYSGLSFKFGFSTVKHNLIFENNLIAKTFSWSYLGRIAMTIKGKELDFSPFIGLDKNLNNMVEYLNFFQQKAKIINLTCGFSMRVHKPRKRHRQRK